MKRDLPEHAFACPSCREMQARDAARARRRAGGGAMGKRGLVSPLARGWRIEIVVSCERFARPPILPPPRPHAPLDGAAALLCHLRARIDARPRGPRRVRPRGVRVRPPDVLPLPRAADGRLGDHEAREPLPSTRLSELCRTRQPGRERPVRRVPPWQLLSAAGAGGRSDVPLRSGLQKGPGALGRVMDWQWKLLSNGLVRVCWRHLRPLEQRMALR